MPMARISPNINSDRLFITCNGSSVANAVAATVNIIVIAQSMAKARFVFLVIFLFLRFVVVKLKYLFFGQRFIIAVFAGEKNLVRVKCQRRLPVHIGRHTAVCCKTDVRVTQNIILFILYGMLSANEQQRIAVENESFISIMENSANDARRALDMAGVKAHVKYTTKDDYAVIAMVEQGLGISIMPELLLGGLTHNVKLMPLDNRASRIIGAAVPEKNSDNATAQKFIAHMQRWIAARYAPHAE